MPDRINRVPEKHPENDTPIVIDNQTNAEEAKHKHMEHMADKLAHKANERYRKDQENDKFSNI